MRARSTDLQTIGSDRGGVLDLHLFWIGRPLNPLEHWCLDRFRRGGFHPRLWTYHRDLAVPAGVRLEPAETILPAEEAFLNRRGSYASFADLFRYTLLARHGGLWSDLDMVCLCHADQLPRESFLVSERQQEGNDHLNNNLIGVFSPSARQQMALLAQRAAAVPRDQVVWAQLGPQLLQAQISTTADHGFTIQPPAFANPFNWWDVPNCFLNAPAPPDLHQSHFLHLYAERWRRAGCDINAELDGGQRLEAWLAGQPGAVS